MFSAASELLYRVSWGQLGTPPLPTQAPILKPESDSVEGRVHEVITDRLSSSTDDKKVEQLSLAQHSISPVTDDKKLEEPTLAQHSISPVKEDKKLEEPSLAQHSISPVKEDKKLEEPSLAQHSISPVTDVDEKGNTQLHRALLLGQKESLNPPGQEIIRFLKLGVDPNVQNQAGDTVLHLIAEFPYWGIVHEQLVRILLSYGAKANLPNKRGVTALHRVVTAKANAQIVDTLIKDGLAEVNAQDNKGNAALHRAADSDRSLNSVFDIELAKVLILHGARVDLQNNEGNTPLHIAITSQTDPKKAIQFFICDEHASINVQNNNGDTPLHLLAGYNQWDKWNHKALVEFLLSQGANKTIQNKKGELPIHKAQNRYGSEVIDLLLADVNLETVDSQGHSPLHLAAMDSCGNLDDFRKILEKSKDVMTADKLGNTALHYAASSGFYEAAELLIARGAAVDIANNEGNSPLYLAVQSLLIESYKPISSTYKLDEMREIITVLHSAKKDASKQVRFNLDPRFINLYYNVLRRIINLLLDNKSNPYQKNKKGESSIDNCFNWAKMYSTYRTEDFFNEVRRSLNYYS